jgi:hypothetical protein
VLLEPIEEKGVKTDEGDEGDEEAKVLAREKDQMERKEFEERLKKRDEEKTTKVQTDLFSV